MGRFSWLIPGTTGIPRRKDEGEDYGAFLRQTIEISNTGRAQRRVILKTAEIPVLQHLRRDGKTRITLAMDVTGHTFAPA